MSSQYIIDGYNITNHLLFNRLIPGKKKEPRISLLDFLINKRPCGSPKNKVIVVFDGFSDLPQPQGRFNIEVIFSGRKTADERIKKILEESPNPRNIRVVSDDKEIRFFARYCHAESLSVEDFIKPKSTPVRKEALKPELNYTQIHKINQELSRIWLK